MQEATNGSISHTSMFPSLSPSPPLCLRINKNFTHPGLWMEPPSPRAHEDRVQHMPMSLSRSWNPTSPHGSLPPDWSVGHGPHRAALALAPPARSPAGEGEDILLLSPRAFVVTGVTL